MISEMEINAPSIADKLKAVSVLNNADVDINIDAAPWIPGMSDINALLGVLPENVGVRVSPLYIRHMGEEVTLAGRTFSQNEIFEAYELHKESIGENDRVKWK
jgi:DNA repair photolyase